MVDRMNVIMCLRQKEREREREREKICEFIYASSASQINVKAIPQFQYEDSMGHIHSRMRTQQTRIK
jgi:hypothetical protein